MKRTRWKEVGRFIHKWAAEEEAARHTVPGHGHRTRVRQLRRSVWMDMWPGFRKIHAWVCEVS